jgi:hypothetical protein
MEVLQLFSEVHQCYFSCHVGMIFRLSAMFLSGKVIHNICKCQNYDSHVASIPLWLPRHSGFALVHPDSLQT